MYFKILFKVLTIVKYGKLYSTSKFSTFNDTVAYVPNSFSSINPTLELNTHFYRNAVLRINRQQNTLNLHQDSSIIWDVYDKKNNHIAIHNFKFFGQCFSNMFIFYFSIFKKTGKYFIFKCSLHI